MNTFFRNVLVILATSVALMLTSCGPSDEDINVDLNADGDDVCEDVADVMCYNMFQCCTGKQREIKLGEEITITEEECRDDMTLSCKNDLANVLQSFESETITIDAETANACLDALLLQDDDMCFSELLEPEYISLCSGVSIVQGQVSEGQACLWHFECAGDSFCGNDFLCYTLPGEGEDCIALGIAGAPCASNLYCDPTDNTCTAFQGAGDACNLSDKRCDDETHYCDGYDPSAAPPDGTCQPLLAIGETCDDSTQCAGNVCEPGTCIMDNEFCMADEDCTGTCANTTSPCDVTADNCTLLCSGDWITECDFDADCGTAGGDCQKPTCEPQECIGGGVCGGSFQTQDFCTLGMEAPCEVFPEGSGCF